jgi:hypothetical protein
MRVAEFMVDWRVAFAAVGRLTFVLLVAAAVVGDVRARRIPNRLNGVLAVAGLTAALVASGLPGLLAAAGCAAVGLPRVVSAVRGRLDRRWRRQVSWPPAATGLTPLAILRASGRRRRDRRGARRRWMIRLRGFAFSAMRLAHAAHNPQSAPRTATRERTRCPHPVRRGARRRRARRSRPPVDQPLTAPRRPPRPLPNSMVR